jgi:hypothetical protein
MGMKQMADLISSVAYEVCRRENDGWDESHKAVCRDLVGASREWSSARRLIGL